MGQPHQVLPDWTVAEEARAVRKVDLTIVPWLAVCYTALNNFAGLLAVRVLTGCMEAGFAPGVAFYLSFWYKKYEVSSRWAYMFGTALILSSFGGLVAYGVAAMNGLGGVSGWRWLFILEGAVSVLLGIISIFYLPDYPQTCSFLSIREKEIVIGRLPPTAPSIATKQLRMSEILDEFRDWRMYALSAALLLHLTVVFSIANFLPTVIQLMGFQSTTAQLLSIPPFVVGAIWILIVPPSGEALSWSRVHSAGNDGVFPSVIPSIQYTDTMVVPLIVGLSTISTKGTSRTAIRSAFTIACGNIGGAVGGQIYRTSDAPFFPRGHLINGCLLIGVLILFVTAVISLNREGEYVGPKANLTVFEVGGIEVEGAKVISFDQ
ncbi:hypothetical protein HDU93_009384, partial [Gonapodya sp. JEL0774]